MIELEHFRMAYDDLGQGRPLVLVHGFPLSRAIWPAQAAQLSAHYRVLTPDLRGHGDSEATPGPYTMDLLADDILALLEALQIDQPIVLGGLSMGGYVVMAFARRYPERLAGLLLTATRAGSDTSAGKDGRRQAVAAVQQAGNIQPTVDGMLPKLFAPQTYSDNPNLVQKVRRIIEHTSMDGVINAQLGMLARPDSTAMLSNLDVPSLVIHGEHDQIIPLEAAQEMASVLSNGSMAVIKGAGHLLNMEQPAEFNQIVMDWLAGL